jgi:hypothetical protein
VLDKDAVLCHMELKTSCDNLNVERNRALAGIFSKVLRLNRILLVRINYLRKHKHGKLVLRSETIVLLALC